MHRLPCGGDRLSRGHMSQSAARHYAMSPSVATGFRRVQAFRVHRHNIKQARCRLCAARCQASMQSTDREATIYKSPEVGKGKKLLIIGGTGRVGSSTAASLRQTHPNLTITLGSQSKESYDAAVKNRPALHGLEFRKLNRNDLQSILSAVKECDIVLHCAGPFQRKNECLVLEAAIEAKKPYIGEMSSCQHVAKIPHVALVLMP